MLCRIWDCVLVHWEPIYTVFCKGTGVTQRYVESLAECCTQDEFNAFIGEIHGIVAGYEIDEEETKEEEEEHFELSNLAKRVDSIKRI